MNINVQSAVEENDSRPTSLELTPHDPIEITSDSDFEVFPGSGTQGDPYVIEGYDITTTDNRGIYIDDTTKYFIVRNCYVDAEEYGIYIDDVADGTTTVINNTCNYNKYGGIVLSSSVSSTVINNTCNNNSFKGIYLYHSGSSNVINNTCNNNYDGIILCYSSSSTIANNTFSNNNHGIYLYSSSSSTIANNTFSNNNEGISLSSSDSSTVANNTFTNCGLYIYEGTGDAYISYTVENNLVNGKILGFYTNIYSMIITEPVYGQLILINCANVIVSDQILNNASYGLFLYSCRHSSIINNTCSNNNRGINLQSSGSSTVANNTCSNNYNNPGISLSSSGSSTVVNNTCNSNYSGISFSSSGSSTVANNTCNNNQYSIFLSSSSSSTVANNTCRNNNKGISLLYSDLCVFTYNLLQENEGYGVYLYNSDDNLIHHNTFVDNNVGGFNGGFSQAFDDGQTNTWYDPETKEGNFWSDWSGTGSYSIDGSASSEDLYPLEDGEHTITASTTTEDTTIVSTTDENPLNFTFTLLILVVPLMLTRIISKKVKK